MQDESDSCFATRCACILIVSLKFLLCLDHEAGFLFYCCFSLYFSLSVAVPLTKEDRQFCVQFAVIGSFERLERKPQGSRDASHLSPKALGRLSMSRSVSLKGQELPDPLFPR